MKSLAIPASVHRPEHTIIIPPGFVELLPGQDLKKGDCYYRHAFGQFLPFSDSQMKTCDHVITGEVVIRPTKEGEWA